MPKTGFKVITVRDYAYDNLQKAVRKYNKGKLAHEQKSVSSSATEAIIKYASSKW